MPIKSIHISAVPLKHDRTDGTDRLNKQTG